MSIIEDAIDILKEEEGWSATPYRDGDDWAIAYGRNLIKDPLTKLEGEFLLLGGVELRLEGLLVGIPFWKELPETARTILICMAYQMGVAGTLAFEKTLAFMRDEDWAQAANEMLDSNWGRDPKTEGRAWRMSQYIAEIPYEDNDF